MPIKTPVKKLKPAKRFYLIYGTGVNPALVWRRKNKKFV
uniref:Uncharacterized protein n=1 Tax=uncultured bacterium contig00023 TaxID=1181512 RepID=A0A806KLB2_9BACT|nr:hypothetical protein [uncultured bacterium contig00023]